MEQDFYVGRLPDDHGLEVLVPDEKDRRIVHDVIYTELCVGVLNESSRREYRRIMRELSDRGAECMLFGCTEIDLLVTPAGAPVPIFDTTSTCRKGCGAGPPGREAVARRDNGSRANGRRAGAGQADVATRPLARAS
jgi:aspartate/glutamate racemase